MLLEVMRAAKDKRTEALLKASKRKKNNPKNSKTTKLNSFIDVFGGMADYPNTNRSGKGFKV